MVLLVLAKYASKVKPSSLFLNYCICLCLYSKNFSVRKGCFVSKISHLNSTQLNSTQSSKAKQVGECGKEMHVNKNRVMMTEEQMEVLRQQIAAYAIISDQLVQMHKAFSAQHTHSGLSLCLFSQYGCYLLWSLSHCSLGLRVY